MGYWSTNDDSNEMTYNMWGDDGGDVLDDYFGHLILTDKKRLDDMSQLVEDAKIITWFDPTLQKSMSKDDTDGCNYGINFSYGRKHTYLDYYMDNHGGELPEAYAPLLTPYISYQEIATTFGYEKEGNGLFAYMWHLSEVSPEKLTNKRHMIEATRLLTYNAFFELKGRVAKEEEIRFILESTLHQLPWMALVK